MAEDIQLSAVNLRKTGFPEMDRKEANVCYSCISNKNCFEFRCDGSSQGPRSIVLTHWTAEYEAQRVRHPPITVGVFVAVDNECALLSRKSNIINGETLQNPLWVSANIISAWILAAFVTHAVRISGLSFWKFISQLIQ